MWQGQKTSYAMKGEAADTLQADAVIDYADDTVAIIRHDARQLPLDDASVDLIVTSPP